MILWLYSLPMFVTGLGIVFTMVSMSTVGLLVVRKWILPRLRIHSDDSDFSSGMVQAVMVFYGLALALIAVNVWQTYSNVSQTVSQEATSLAALYRDVSGYPEPLRTELQADLRSYVDDVIHNAWPTQRRGLTPNSGVKLMNEFQVDLVAFEPKSEGQKMLHGETLRAYNLAMLNRRLRLDAVQTSLPGLLWLVIVIGAVISLSSSFFFKVEDFRLHSIQVGLLAAFIGVVIFMVLALDRPFLGDLGLSSAPYQLVYDQLMK